MLRERISVTQFAAMTGLRAGVEAVEEPEKHADGEEEKRGQRDIARGTGTDDAHELRDEGRSGAEGGREAEVLDSGVGEVGREDRKSGGHGCLQKKYAAMVQPVRTTMVAQDVRIHAACVLCSGVSADGGEDHGDEAVVPDDGSAEDEGDDGAEVREAGGEHLQAN